MYFDCDKFPEERFLLFTIITNRLHSRVLAFATIQKSYVLYVYTCMLLHVFVLTSLYKNVWLPDEALEHTSSI
jgi:hypothetical protein